MFREQRRNRRRTRNHISMHTGQGGHLGYAEVTQAGGSRRVDEDVYTLSTSDGVKLIWQRVVFTEHERNKAKQQGFICCTLIQS